MANSDTKLVNELYTLAATLGGEYERGDMWDWETVHEAALRIAGFQYQQAKIEELCDRACGEGADMDQTEALMKIWEFVNPGVNDPEKDSGETDQRQAEVSGRDPEESISRDAS